MRVAMISSTLEEKKVRRSPDLLSVIYPFIPKTLIIYTIQKRASLSLEPVAR
jgi:hypothetical protein